MLYNTKIDIALYKPEIPSNTGNIGRLCVGTGSSLHLVGKPSFLLRDKDIKRAGLDYWDKLTLIKHQKEEDFIDYCNDNNKSIIVVSKFGKVRHDLYNFSLGHDIILLFGQESKGVQGSLFETSSFESVFIPMTDNIRSINLSNSAAIVLYEALRQIDFNSI